MWENWMVSCLCDSWKLKQENIWHNVQKVIIFYIFVNFSPAFCPDLVFLSLIWTHFNGEYRVNAGMSHLKLLSQY